MVRHVCVLLLLLFHCTTAGAQFDAGRAELAISVNNEIYPYRVFATYVLPAEHLGLCLLTENPANYVVVAEDGVLDRLEDCRWIWTAPDEPGLYQVRVLNTAATEVMSLNVFVMLPAYRLAAGQIDDYVIGDYPVPLDDSPLYQPPDGYIRVTADVLNTQLSPNFELGQFVSPLDENFPKYVVLRERLLLKLEALLERLNERGIVAQSLSVIAGYYPPEYNRRIGGQMYNRHIYGGAATIIVDRDGDGVMDDLDGNGSEDPADGLFLFELIDELYQEPGKEYLSGGLFLYGASADRGASIMIDARGFRRRWQNPSEVPPLPEELRPKHKRDF
ncbi:MAG: hypothetical protein RL120_12940 [Gammaproteobacteria bacterium]